MPKMLIRALLLPVVLLAACGGDDDAGDATADAPAATAPAEPSGGGDATVALSKTSAGDVLVDADGRTLYLFTRDASGTSNCTDACAELWPPVQPDGDATAGEGLDESKLGTITRPGGLLQVTYAGHPLYRYAPDAKPGDVTGQGVGGVWFVVDADGEAVTSVEQGAGTPRY